MNITVNTIIYVTIGLISLVVGMIGIAKTKSFATNAEELNAFAIDNHTARYIHNGIEYKMKASLLPNKGQSIRVLVSKENPKVAIPKQIRWTKYFNFLAIALFTLPVIVMSMII